MSYLVLARKWRPATFDQVIGQDGVVRTLKNAISVDRVAHAYLFCGARGVGKTTVARILAKALNCAQGPTPTPDDTCTSCVEITRGISPDVLEIDGASNTGVDDVRSLRENSRYMPARSRFKIYIIDEVHMLSTSAFNALLKTLEEPPRHVKFIFATTEPHKIPLTVLSRCQRFDFKRIPSATIFEQLRKILVQEGAQIEEEGVRAIAREAAGSMRDALSLTDQVLAFGGEKITAEQVLEALGLTTSGMYEEVIHALVDKQPEKLMQLVDSLFEESHDLKRFLEGLLWHVRHLIFYRSLKDADSLVDVVEEERKRLRHQSQQTDALTWHRVFDVLSRALEDLAHNPHPRLVVETALLRLSAIEPLLEVDSLLERVEQLARKIDGAPAGKGTAVSGRPEKRGQNAGDCEASREKPAGPLSPRPGEAAPRIGEPIEHPADPATGEMFPQGWEKLVALVSKRRPSLGSVLNHARPLEVAPERVRIALEPGSFFSDQMKTERNRRDLERFCGEFFGKKTELVIEERGEGTGMTLAEVWQQAKHDAESDLRKQALSHPMVQEAIRVFGAEVEQVRPAERKEP